MDEFITALEAWVKATMVSLMLGADSTDSTEEIRRVVELTTKVRQLHDEKAKAQGNPTVRKRRADEGKTNTLTEEEAAAKVAELIG